MPLLLAAVMSALSYWVMSALGLWVLVIAYLASDGLLGFIGAVTLAGGIFFAIEDGRP